MHLRRFVSNLCVFVNNYHLQFILTFSTLKKFVSLVYCRLLPTLTSYYSTVWKKRCKGLPSPPLPSPPLSLLPSLSLLPPKNLLKYDCNKRMIIVMTMIMIMTMIVITTMTMTMTMMIMMTMTVTMTMMTIMKMIKKKKTKFYRSSGDIVTSEPIRFSFSLFLHSASLCISSWPSYWWLVHWATRFMRMRCPRLTTWL